ncbi:hypothetical protein H110_06651 [Trichophyton rubrum MR1448]|nr:hypothetical protein H110_06651 [Trichophyton rubrum MR1448]
MVFVLVLAPTCSWLCGCGTCEEPLSAVSGQSSEKLKKAYLEDDITQSKHVSGSSSKMAEGKGSEITYLAFGNDPAFIPPQNACNHSGVELRTVRSLYRRWVSRKRLASG